MTTTASQLRAVADLLDAFPDLPAPTVISGIWRNRVAVEVQPADFPAWLDAIEVLPPGDDAWTQSRGHLYESLTIPPAPGRPFEVFTLRAAVSA